MPGAQGMRMKVLALLCGLALVGCAPKVSYDVTVKNDLAQPVTLWLTKPPGSPLERAWLSPEDIARGVRPGNEKITGVVLPPGKTGRTGAVKGEFPDEMRAILRVYLGQHPLSELLAMSRGHGRIDVDLEPGHNELVVRERDGRMVVDPVGR